MFPQLNICNDLFLLLFNQDCKVIENKCKLKRALETVTKFGTHFFQYCIHFSNLSSSYINKTSLLHYTYYRDRVRLNILCIGSFIATCSISPKGQTHFNTAIRQYPLINNVTTNQHPISRQFEKLTRNLSDCPFISSPRTVITLMQCEPYPV